MPIDAREVWFQELTEHIRPWYAVLGYPIPPVQVSCGFPSAGLRSKVIGECWAGTASADNRPQIFISPKYDSWADVVGILVHELIHSAVGNKCKHHGPFKTVAVALGLEGDMKATHAGAALLARLEPIIFSIGPYPHSALAGLVNPKKKQTTRMIKCVCPGCGYMIRTTRQWLDRAIPQCGECEMQFTYE